MIIPFIVMSLQFSGVGPAYVVEPYTFSIRHCECAQVPYGDVYCALDDMGNDWKLYPIWQVQTTKEKAIEVLRELINEESRVLQTRQNQLDFGNPPVYEYYDPEAWKDTEDYMRKSYGTNTQIEDK